MVTSTFHSVIVYNSVNKIYPTHAFIVFFNNIWSWNFNRFHVIPLHNIYKFEEIWPSRDMVLSDVNCTFFGTLDLIIVSVKNTLFSSMY